MPFVLDSCEELPVGAIPLMLWPEYDLPFRDEYNPLWLFPIPLYPKFEPSPEPVYPQLPLPPIVVPVEVLEPVFVEPEGLELSPCLGFMTGFVLSL